MVAMTAGWYCGPYAYSDPSFPTYPDIELVSVAATAGTAFSTFIANSQGSDIQILDAPEGYTVSSMDDGWYLNGVGLQDGSDLVLLIQSGAGVRNRTFRFTIQVAGSDARFDSTNLTFDSTDLTFDRDF